MFDDTDKNLDSPQHKGSESEGSIFDQLKSGFSDLAEKAKVHVQYLKDGGKSGVTDEFGKPVIEGFDDSSTSTDDNVGHAILDASMGLGAGPPGGDAAVAEPSDTAHTPTDRSHPAEDMSPYGSAYAGEGLTRNIAAGKLVVQRPRDEAGNPTGEKETIEDVVMNHLQSQDVNLNEEELQRYVREVKELNHISDPTDVPEGQTILLPGHNKNGDLIVQEHDDTTRIVTGDGAVSIYDPANGHAVEYRPHEDGSYTLRTYDGDGTTHVIEHIPDGDGGYVERHNVSSIGDSEGSSSYEITRTPDGGYEIREEGGAPWDKTEYDPDDPDPRIERARLSDLARATIADPEDLQRFQENMSAFEQRAREQNLTPQDKAKFYHQVTRLMEAGDSTNPDLPGADDRVHIAEQIMAHAADPQLIDQGQHNTCAAAALESQMFTRNPELAARIIVDVATQGAFETTSGRRIEPHSSLLKADGESSQHPPADNSRSYASQLFQSAALSTEYSSYRTKSNPERPGQLLEVCDKSEIQAKHPDMHFSGNSEVIGFPGISADELQRINNELAGDANPLSIIKHASAPPEGVGSNVSSERDLEDRLQALSNDGKLPALIYVDSGNQPFLADSLGGVAGGSGAGHWVTVTAFDKNNGTVSVDNQWGSGFDREMTLAELYAATKPVSGHPT
ncbi:MAG TPA: hypothetical protein V6D08_00165 [Candidatus Obscuribacterales bacterium]